MPPPPFVTCLITDATCFAAGRFVRSGPPLPPVPAEPWHVAQLSAKTALPAAAVAVAPAPPPPPPVFGGVFPVSPACSTPEPAPGAATWFSWPSSEKSQRLSPCGEAASALPPA